jgi:NADPH-dependent 2,4-dienoyl-CoA reductase/sulfur reductase-like enzyme
MKHADVVIIGGGPAGVTCAISAKNTYPTKNILLIRKEEKPMIPCGIPYTLHSLKNVDENILPDTPLNNNKIEIMVDEVEDKKEKKLILKSGQTIEFEKLVLATGSKAIEPPIKGIHLDGIYLVKKNRDYLCNLVDKSKSAKSITILGGGYIGVEVADELLKAGKEVTIVEQLSCLLPTSMDCEFGDKAHEVIENSGGKVLLNKSVVEIEGTNRIEKVVFDDGSKINTDMLIIGCGYKPNLELAKKLDLVVDEKHGILVDEYLRTSDKNTFAIGDCAAKLDFFTGNFSNVMLASTAMAEGRLVGSNLFSIKVIRKYKGIMGSFSTKIGGTAFGVSGLIENRAKEMGLDYVVGVAKTIDRHPGKLPGSSPVYLKLIFSKYSHALVGGEIYGGDSVGELVNMLSVMILNQMTDMDIDTLQIGTHPLLTASPVVYPVINATADAIKKWYVYQSEESSEEIMK